MNRPVLLIFTLFFALSIKCFGVMSLAYNEESLVWNKINANIDCPSPKQLVYPFPDKFNEWLDGIDENLKFCNEIEDDEVRAHYYYLLEQSIKGVAFPNGYPLVIKRLESMGISFEYRELAGGYVYTFSLTDKIVSNFPNSNAARLIAIRAMANGESYSVTSMTNNVIKNGIMLLKTESLNKNEKALIYLYLAEAFETEWAHYRRPSNSALSVLYASNKADAKKETFKYYSLLANMESPLKIYANNKLQELNKTNKPDDKYNVFE